MYPPNEKTWTPPQIIFKYHDTDNLKAQVTTTMYSAILTWCSHISDLNKIIKQEQKEVQPSTFTSFTKQKIIHYATVSGTVSAPNCCTDTGIWKRELSLLIFSHTDT